jgi:acetolactate synthase I/II/III large subunit
MKTGELLAELLVGYGVRYVFGIPGGLASMYNAIGRSGGKIQHILVRDERSSVYAADAYGRVAGHVAVCDAVPGCGVVKLPSGLSEAYDSSTPVVVIAADIPRASRRFARYACAAQGMDQAALLAPVSKAVISIHSSADLPAAVHQAFREATTGRPGPVVIDLPTDVCAEECDPNEPPAVADERFSTYPALRTRPPSDAVDAAARLLIGAQRPVMVVGGGGMISRAYDQVRALAELLQMPVATSVSGKGIIEETHLLAIGVLGGQYGEESANQVVRAADVVFLVGFKSSQQSTFMWKLPTPEQQVIHLDVDPYEIGKVFKTEVGLVGDAAVGLEDVRARVAQLQPRAPERGAFLALLDEARRAWLADIGREMLPSKPIQPAYVVREVQRHLGPEDIVVSDASFSTGWVASFYDVQRAGRHCLFPRGSATLGFSLPATIGASLAAPGKRVAAIAGDGGITYGLGELSTLTKYSLPVTIVILNNSCLGYSRWGERHGERRYENVEFPPTNFAQIAQGFGCVGLRVEDPGDLGDALAQAVKLDGPAVIDVTVDEWATPELRLRRERTVVPA